MKENSWSFSNSALVKDKLAVMSVNHSNILAYVTLYIKIDFLECCIVEPR